MNKSKLPPECGARVPVTNEPIVIRRGETGYYNWGAFATIAKTPEEFNALHNISDDQVQAMLVGSMFGWDAKAANPDWYAKQRRRAEQRNADRVDGYDRDDLGESPDY